MFAPTRAALAATATASACLALRPAAVVGCVGVRARCLSIAAVATTTSSSSASTSSNTLLARARAPPSLPNIPRRRALHTTPPTRFDAHSLDATAGEEGVRVGAVLTAFRRPVVEDGEEGGWRGRDPTIVLTRRAVERLQAIATSSSSSPGPGKEDGEKESLALRLAVEPGGCHGYQYKIELVDEADEDDFHFQPPPPRHQISPEKPKPLPILIDSTSLQLLQGATLDFVTELIGSQFAVRENPQAKGGGCGCGVSWEPAV